jgi:hydroxymethylglutaryl-CoA reductase (NADPH)
MLVFEGGCSLPTTLPSPPSKTSTRRSFSRVVNVLVHPTSLAYALPFLIALIGFDKPLRIAHATFHTRLPCILFCCTCHTLRFGSPGLSILIDSLSSAYPAIVRDYFIEITLLASAACLPIGALRQLCTLAALALTMQYFLVSSYFIFVLSDMLRICILKLPKNIGASVAASISPPSPPRTPPIYPSLSSYPKKAQVSTIPT